MNDIDESLSRIREAATRLNAASDAMCNSVREIEIRLARANTGVTAVIDVPKTSLQLAYGRLPVRNAAKSKAWGILIINGPNLYHFQAAPRAMRIASVESIPALLEELLQNTQKLIEDTRSAADLAESFAKAISEASSELELEKDGNRL